MVNLLSRKKNRAFRFKRFIAASKVYKYSSSIFSMGKNQCSKRLVATAAVAHSDSRLVSDATLSLMLGFCNVIFDFSYLFNVLFVSF